MVNAFRKGPSNSIDFRIGRSIDHLNFDKGPWNSTPKVELPKLEILEKLKEKEVIISESLPRKLKIK